MGLLDAIGNIIKNVTVIIFLTTILDLLLPGSKLQPFVKMVMGLFVVVTIITPVVNLFNDQTMLSGWTMPQSDYQGVDSIMAQGEQYNAQIKNQTMQEYEVKLGQQMKGLVALTPSVENCEVKVILDADDKLGSMGSIRQVEIWASVFAEDETLAQRTQGQISKMLANYYGLTQEQIIVNMMEGADHDEENGG